MKLFSPTLDDEESLELLARMFATHDWAFVEAMCFCAERGLPLPDWVAKEWLARAKKAMVAQAPSWDDVMPKILPSGRRRASVNRALRYGLSIAVAVDKAKRKGAPVDIGLFEALAKENNWPISASSVRDIYYMFLKGRLFPDGPHDRRFLLAGRPYKAPTAKSVGPKKRPSKKGQ